MSLTPEQRAAVDLDTELEKLSEAHQLALENSSPHKDFRLGAWWQTTADALMMFSALTPWFDVGDRMGIVLDLAHWYVTKKHTSRDAGKVATLIGIVRKQLVGVGHSQHYERLARTIADGPFDPPVLTQGARILYEQIQERDPERVVAWLVAKQGSAEVAQQLREAVPLKLLAIHVVASAE